MGCTCKHYKHLLYIYIYVCVSIVSQKERNELAPSFLPSSSKALTLGRGKYAVGGKWKRIFGSAYLVNV